MRKPFQKVLARILADLNFSNKLVLLEKRNTVLVSMNFHPRQTLIIIIVSEEFTIDRRESVVDDYINPLSVPPKPEVKYSRVFVREALVFWNASFEQFWCQSEARKGGY